MPGRYGSKYSANKSRKSGKRKNNKKNSTVPSSIRTYVNKLVNHTTELKISSVQYSLTGFNSGINVIGDLITVCPPVSQGLTQKDRVGNAIRPKELTITGYVVYTAQSIVGTADAKLIGARLFCFKDRTTSSYANATILNYQLLNLGGTPINYTGSAMNFVSPHNNDMFTFYADKSFKFMKPYGLFNNVTPSTTVALTAVDPSLIHPFKIVIKGKDLPAILKFDQTSSTAYPTNWAPFIALGYSDLFNSAADTTTTQLSMEFCSTLSYYDA